MSAHLRHLPALIGRSGEQARLDALLDAGRLGQSGALVVRGEPGVGKTSLLDYAVSRAGDFRVLRTMGAESESDLAFSGLLDLLRPVLNRAEELPDIQAHALAAALGGSGEVDRFPVYAATLGVVALVAEDGPLLCVMDDAQWVDPASSGALLFTARRLADEGVVVLFGARDGEAVYFEGRGIPDTVLGGLGVEDAGRLVRESSALPLAPGVVTALVAATSGNPLALVEIPAGLRDGQRLGTEPLDDPLRGGAAVERAFGARFGALSEHARRALLVAAVSDTDTLPAILQAAAHNADGLDEAEAAGLVHVANGRLRFRHPLVRSAVYSSTSDGERRGAHAALAAALATVDPDRAAWHRALATVGHDEQVASELAQVALGARRRGGAEAQARLLERAARLTPNPERRAQRLHDAGRAAYHAGRVGYAGALLDEALTLTTDPLLRADLVESRMGAAREHDEVAQWVEACREEADRVAAHDPQRALRLLWHVLWYLVEQVEVANGRLILDRMIALSRNPDDDLHILAARAWQGTLENDVAEVRVATRRFSELAVGLAERACDVSWQVIYVGDFDTARAVLEPMIEHFRREGSFFDLVQALGALATLEGVFGRLVSAEAAASEAVELSIETGLLYREGRLLTQLASIEGKLGKHAECERHARRALELHAVIGQSNASAIAWFALGLGASSSGRTDAAIEAFERCRDLLAGTPGDFWQPELIEAYLRAGRVVAARALLVTFEAEATRLGHELALLLLARCRAILSEEPEAEAAYEQALSLCDPVRWPFQHARCELANGERLRRSGRRVAARTRLRSALDLFARIGAAGFAERARQELLATGETLRARTGDGPEQLTPQELQIALLVARGATNREAAASVFLSPKTVERHLSNAYRKLGVRSRSELARRLANV